MQALRAAAADLVWVLAFAIIGRRSHAGVSDATRLFDAAGVLHTAWPFLTGCLAGLLASRFWRQPDSLRTGVIVWLCTLTLGVLLRLVSGETAQLSFLVVTAVFLASGVLGWRAVTRTVRRASARRTSAERL